MTLAEFYKLELWRSARELANSPMFKVMLDVLKTEAPPVIGIGLSGTDYAYTYGREIEHKRMLAIINAMCNEPPKSAMPPEATFADENQEEKQTEQ